MKKWICKVWGYGEISYHEKEFATKQDAIDYGVDYICFNDNSAWYEVTRK